MGWLQQLASQELTDSSSARSGDVMPDTHSELNFFPNDIYPCTEILLLYDLID